VRRSTALVLNQLIFALVAMTTGTAIADDPIPAPGYETGTRMIKIVAVRSAPVVIDYAYVTLHDGADGKRDSSNAACIRYRNVSRDTILSVRFELTYFDASGQRLGENTVLDSTKRVPNPNAKPGVVPVGSSYWRCTQMPNPYGASLSTAMVAPAFVTFVSRKAWHT